MADKIRVSKSGTGDPTTATPTFKGEIYLNETSGELWRAYGTSAGNWYKITDSNNVPVKATGAELTTGTDDAKFATAKALKDSVIYGKNQKSDASSTTPTPSGNYSNNEYFLTALAADATFSIPSGTPVNGNKLVIRIKDNGTARTLAWNAIYRAIGLTLPTTTVINKTLYLGFIYNSADSKWDLVASAQEE